MKETVKYEMFNKNTKEVVFEGTKEECQAFAKGLEYGDNIDDSIPYFTTMRAVEPQ